LHDVKILSKYCILHHGKWKSKCKTLSFDVHFTAGKNSYFLKGFAACKMKNFGKCKIDRALSVSLVHSDTARVAGVEGHCEGQIFIWKVFCIYV